MSSRQFLTGIGFGALIGVLVSFFIISNGLFWPSNYTSIDEKQKSDFELQRTSRVEALIVPEGLNFITAAQRATPAVVLIRASSTGRGTTNLMGQLFNNRTEGAERRRRGPFSATGSGVVLTSDGYIATNHHVIEHAERIDVTLDDNRTYQAKYIGSDPQTDLALLKISESGLPFIMYGNSDEVQIGEWVLAVGNPFDLNSTVTAGIVSAKARNINILRQSNLSVESFIQTDAVVNPGNSGGALVNLRGELIGINTAIATRTGTFNGYSFAVPVSLVKKVMDDLLEYGLVQRALLGVNINNVTADKVKEFKLGVNQGVFVEGVNIGSAAYDAGILERDVIVEIEGVKITNISELQEQVARHRPGKKINVKVFRGEKEMNFEAVLKSTEGATITTATIPFEPNNIESEGVIFENISEEIKAALSIPGGVIVRSPKEGKWAEAGLRDGFVVTFLGSKRILNVEDMNAAIATLRRGQEIVVIGLNPDSSQSFFTFEW
jgi:serine protease Do